LENHWKINAFSVELFIRLTETVQPKKITKTLKLGIQYHSTSFFTTLNTVLFDWSWERNFEGALYKTTVTIISLQETWGLQYVLSMMHKCIMVKVGGEARKQQKEQK